MLLVDLPLLDQKILIFSPNIMFLEFISDLRILFLCDDPRLDIKHRGEIELGLFFEEQMMLLRHMDSAL